MSFAEVSQILKAFADILVTGASHSSLNGIWLPIVHAYCIILLEVDQNQPVPHMNVNPSRRGRPDHTNNLYCQALFPNPLVPNPQSRGLGLTLKSYGPPPPHPITFEHEGVLW